MTQTAPDTAFNSTAYRKTLGGFGTGVALAAAYDKDGRAHGLIVNSLTSVSLDPPIVLWCLASASSAFEVYTQCDAFSLNILGADFEDHVPRFSARGDRIIPDALIETLSTGAPVLSDAVAVLDCKLRSRQQEGDHEVIFGDVAAFRSSPEADALGFFRGRFVTLTAGQENE